MRSQISLKRDGPSRCTGMGPLSSPTKFECACVIISNDSRTLQGGKKFKRLHEGTGFIPIIGLKSDSD